MFMFRIIAYYFHTLFSFEKIWVNLFYLHISILFILWYL